MEYKISTFGFWELRLEKHMESKGFFRNAAGSSKVGEIRLIDQTNGCNIRKFLTKNNEIYYMELGCVNSPKFSHIDETPLISTGDKENNIPAEERIKFLYEALSSNENYNRLTIIYKSPNIGRHIKLLCEIEKARIQYDDVDVVFYINDLYINDL